MRIIGGHHRGRKLLAPADERTTRPITDRVKEALFSRLMSLGYLGSGHVLDAFAGTGSLGVEALSRGAEHCTFIERDRNSRDLLERNLADLGLNDRAPVLALDTYAGAWLPRLVEQRLSLIFIDPPYRDVTDPGGCERIVRLLGHVRSVAMDDALCVLRTPADTAAPVSETWPQCVTRTYGSQALHFYQGNVED